MTESEMSALVIILSPLLYLLSPPIWMLWPPNWKRYKVGGTRMDSVDGYRITFLPGSKGMRPFLPHNIRITKSWFSWNIEIYGFDAGDYRLAALMLWQDRHPGESWPHPLTIIRWACEDCLWTIDQNPGKPPDLFKMKSTFGRDLVTLETINECAPNYVHVPKAVFRFNDDY